MENVSCGPKRISIDNFTLETLVSVFRVAPTTVPFLLQVDSDVVQSIIFATDPDQHEYVLATLLGYEDCLEIDISTASPTEKLRKLIAFQYFADQLLDNNPLLFVTELHAILTTLKVYLESGPRNLKIFSRAISYSLGNLGRVYKRIHCADSNSNVLRTALEVAWLPGMPTEGVIEYLFVFFIEALLQFEIEQCTESELISSLMNIVISMSAVPIHMSVYFDYVGLANQLLKMIASENISLDTRKDLVILLTTFSVKYEEVSIVIIDCMNLPYFVSFIGDWLATVEFSCERPESPTPQELVGSEVNDFIEPTFSQDINVMTDAERQVKSITLVIPDEPESVAHIKELAILLSILSKLCHSVTLQPYAITHINLMRQVLSDTKIMSLDIAPFFLASWLRHFVQDHFEVVVDALQNIGFYRRLLEMAFLGLRNSELMNFCASLLITIAGKCPTQYLFMYDLLSFLLQCIECLSVSPILAHCVRICAFMAGASFKQAANHDNLQFVVRLSKLMLVLQGMRTEEACEVRRTLFTMLDYMRAEGNVLQYCFARLEYSEFLMRLFYDSSTVGFAVSHVASGLVMFPAHEPCIQFIVKFIMTKLLASSNLTMKTLLGIVECIREAFRVNRIEMGTVFTETHLLDTIVEVCSEMNASDAVVNIINILSESMALQGNFTPKLRIFMKLEPLIDGSITDFLLNMAFKDKLGMSVPRRMINPAPLSLLFRVFAQDEQQLSDYIKFIRGCFEIEKKTAGYELSSAGFSSQLIDYIATFRTQKELTPIFQEALDFFAEISCYTMKANDMKSFFQLFTTLPGNVRPVFTVKLLRVLNEIMSIYKDDEPTTFFSLNGRDSKLHLHDIIQPEIINEGFCLILHIELLSEMMAGASIFTFENNQKEEVTLYFDGRDLVLNGHVIKYTFPERKWFTLHVSYDRSKWKVFIDDELLFEYCCKLSVKNDLTHNTIVEQLNCNLSTVSLYRKPKEYISEKYKVFEFDASLVHETYAVSGSHYATFSGKICQMTPIPRDILNDIGGVSTILPLFAQLEQPTIEGEGSSEPSDEMLALLLQAVKMVLHSSSHAQEAFLECKGFMTMSVLLSLTETFRFKQRTIAFFTELFISLELPLAIEMIEHVFFNFGLWLSLSKSLQKIVLRCFFDHILTLKRQYPDNEDLTECVNVTKVLYLIRCYCYGKSPLFDANEAKVNSARIAEFWDFVNELSEISMTHDDTNTLICFCRDTKNLQLAKDSLHWFLALLESQRIVFLDTIKSFDFREFIPIMGTSDYVVVYYVIIIWEKMSQLGFLSPKYSDYDWVGAMVALIDRESIRPEFLKLLDLQHLSAKPAITGFILYALPSLDNDNLQMYFDQLIRNFTDAHLKFDEHEFFFVMFLIDLFYHETCSELVEYCMEVVAETAIQKSVAKPLESIQLLIEFLELKTDHDFTDFSRKFYSKVLEIIGKRANISIEKMNSIYLSVFYFIFRIPHFDPLYHLPLTPISVKQTKASILSLLPSIAEHDVVTIYYCFATRTNFEGDWIDVDLACKLFNVIKSNRVIQTPDAIGPLDILGIIIGNGLQHKNHSDRFLNGVDIVLSYIPHNNHVDINYRTAFLMVLGGLMRAIDTGNTDRRLYTYLHEFTHSFRDALTSELRMRIPSIRNLDEFTKEMMNMGTHFARMISVEMTKIEESIAINIGRVRTISYNRMSPIDSEYIDTTVVEKTELSLSLFAIGRKETVTQAKKNYRTLFQSLSINNGPWSTPEVSQKVHYLLENSVFPGFVRTRMKPNMNFTQHREASLARDLGSYEDALLAYKKELSKMKMQGFNGDFALMNFEIEDDETKIGETRSTRDNVRLKCDTQLMTPKQVYNGTLSLTNTTVFVDTDERIVKIPLSKITKIYLRRYLLLDTALEIFTIDSKAYFINFVSASDRQTFLNKINTLKTPNMTRKCEDPKKTARRTLAKWEKGKMSNLDFLLKLNKLAGRSYNDLSQYPVMPWILADYTSETLDLSDEKVFRDLSKPIGALDRERLEMMRERMDDAFDEETNYLYGALYSSAAVVIGYLIRMEPFTSMHVKLQSGRFDLPDRLFSGIPSAWESVTSTQMDFRELIPEFFVLPDFLQNTNNFNLGKQAKGGFINDVELPTWAKSARHFVELHRSALESAYVTANLHKWVDLIFGPSSRAPLYVQADNVFHPYFYETAVTPEVAQNPKLLGMIKEYAACFGTVPAQLFDEQPSQRMPMLKPISSLPRCEFVNVSNNPIVALQTEKRELKAIDSKLQFRVLRRSGQSYSEYITGNIAVETPDLPINVKPTVAISKRSVVFSYPWSISFMICDLKNGRCEASPVRAAHKRAISALQIHNNVLVSGSLDCTVRVWKYGKTGDLKQLPVLAKHVQPIAFMKTSHKFGECVSISKDGFMMSISLRDGRYLHGISLGSPDPSELTVTWNGYIIVGFNGPDNHRLCVLDQNMNIVTSDTFDGCIKCCTSIERNGTEFLVVVMKNMKLSILEIPYLEKHLETYISFNVSTMCYSRSWQTCYFGTEDGNIYSFDTGLM